LENLLRQARRRQAWHLALEALTDVLAVAMAAVVVLLAAGLPGRPGAWALATAAVALGFAGWRARRGIGSRFAAARRIDEQLRLHDTLATAVHFLDAGPGEGSAEAVARQRAQAEEAAQVARLSQALPLRRPRAAAACLALLGVSMGLVFLRYATTRKLDLRAPLIAIHFERAPAPELAKLARDGRRSRSGDPVAMPRVPGDPAPATQQGMAQTQDAPSDVLNTVDEPNVDNSKEGAKGEGQAKAKDAEGKETPTGANQDGTQASDDDRTGEGKKDARTGDTPNRDGAAQEAGRKSSNASASPSLMQRARDAMSDLLDKFKSAARSQEGGKDAKSAQESNRSQGQKQAANSANGVSAQNQQGAPDASQQGDSASVAGQKVDAAQAGTGRQGDKNNSPEAQSGIGREDGSKDTRLAEELAAMGKISELIGKRSANVTGEMTVESSSNGQQLKTQYSDQQAAHTAAGGIVDRDEVPIAYQSYVQRYFDQIRKNAPAGARAGSAGAPAGTSQ
jgi:hypothetical protein